MGFLKRIVSWTLLTFLLISTLTLALNIQPVKASGTIYITSDYTFTHNVYEPIVVQADNIVIDGNGYTLQGVSRGIDLTDKSNVTVKNMKIKECYCAIRLEGSGKNTISGNYIAHNYIGIDFQDSSYNNIFGNNISENRYSGIRLFRSSYNNISKNNVMANDEHGIELHGRVMKANNVLRSNNMTSNMYNFYVSGDYLSDFFNDVDSSNMVDGKPVYYWVNERDTTVPLDAGYVALINCTRMTAKNLTLSSNGQGVLLVSTTNSTITTNTMKNNQQGIRAFSSSSNVVYHNNFVDNTYQVSSYGSIIVWDDGYPSGGNYWSDYTDVDLKNGPYQNETGSDGIGDTPYLIDSNNQDNYPFMSPLGDVEPPVADAGSDLTVTRRTTVTFDGSKSIDDVAVKSFVWAFTDVTLQTLTGMQPKYTFNNVGDFEVTLNVSDYAGNWNTDTVAITVLANYTLTVHSSPTGATFTVDGVSHTTPWSGTYSEGASVSLVMPETHGECVWSHWLEDGYPKRIKCVRIAMDTIITFTAVFIPSARVRHVDASNIGDPLEDGTIDHPFDKIQEGIDAASSGYTVLVAAGTYYENIVLKRNARARVQGAGADVTTIDGGGTGSVVTAKYVSSNTVLSGFTIRNGASEEGGGIYVDSSTLLISWNTIVNNTARVGGGIYVAYTHYTHTISNNVIIDNHADWGGGIHVAYWSSTIIHNNTIADNTADGGGGGIRVGETSSVVITENTIRGNTAGDFGGGGVTVGNGGSADITENLISDNNANTFGGGISIKSEAGCCSANISNNIITDNSAGDVGGAISVKSSCTDAQILYNTIAQNNANVTGGGIHQDQWASTTIFNSIIWGNGDDLDGCYATYSDIEDGDLGEGNICADPMFVDVAGSDFHLQAGSPCIDAGTDEDALSIDFEGTARPIDGDGDGIAVVDIGAYEFVPPQHAMRLHVTSSPITGTTFTINGTPQTTPYTQWLPEDSYTLKMPETSNGYAWSHWLEDGDTNRIRTVTMDTNILLTAVFTPLDITPPAISILSPENKTYPTNTVPLTFALSEATSWISYSLDGQANITIAGNTTLTGLSDGMHSLVVYASDIAGNIVSSGIVYFTIDGISPIADAGPNQETNVGKLVTFDATGSTDNVGIVSCEWDFGDGTTDTGITCDHTYAEPGNYTVTLTVKDGAGNLDTDTMIVTVIEELSTPFPWWVVGPIVVVIIGIAVAVTILWRRRK